MIGLRLVVIVALALSLSGFAYADSLEARIPPALTFDDALNDYLLQGTLDSDRMVEVALANDPAAWHQYSEVLGDSFKAGSFIQGFRSKLKERLVRHRDAARYRTRGELVVELGQAGQGGRFHVRPPGELDASLINPNIYGFSRARPALLIKQVLIDFPPPDSWYVSPPDGWAKVFAARTTDDPLRIDATYDFSLTDCQFRQASKALYCVASFDRIEIRAGRLFDQVSQADKRLTAAIQGEIKGS